MLFDIDFFKGYTAFKPVDLRFRVQPVVNFNYLAAQETGVVNIDPSRGKTRWDSQFIALQQAFVEMRVAETSPYFDFISVRAGTQFFNSDFRSFIFFDSEPGIRLFGTLKSNKHQWNVAYFHMLEKDTNSVLNTFEQRKQEVAIANYYIQDFLTLGYTTQFSFHYNHDMPTVHVEKNGFLARPARIGNLAPKSINSYYLGWTGDGHFGVWNINHAFYQVLGRERPNQIAGDVFGPKNTRINAQMAALEISIDRDWRRYRASFFYASGDSDVSDDRATGFDSIFDQVFFAGSGISFWNRQGIPLSSTEVRLTQRSSLHPGLRSSKEEGQANHVNPGIFLVNAGTDIEMTPKLKLTANVNVLAFAKTEVLETLLFQAPVRRFIGVDIALGSRWRPWLNNNVILSSGVAVLLPGRGFRDIYPSKGLISMFLDLTVQF